MAGIIRSAAIKAFLEKKTWPDLAMLYTKEMEVQVNVAQDGGELINRQYQGHPYREYTDGVQSWKMFRMPLNSMTEPEDNDKDLLFDLALHVEGIGMTGWNWVKRRSLWVAFDFDAISGHSERHTKKLTPVELDEVKRKVNDIEWVTLRRSTGGSGLHIYVFLDFDQVINNHNEHMAIGRSVLSQLSALTGFDFEAKVDVNAGNMWVWHRKLMRPGGERNPHGLELLKPGGKLNKLPEDWRDYIDVVSGKRQRTIPFFIKNASNPVQELDLFEELSNQRAKIPLDKEHQKLLDWIQQSTPGGSWWRDDHWMLVTHTYTLKEAFHALGMKGQYDTLASGREATQGSDWNCFSGDTEIITRDGVMTLKEASLNGQAYLYVWTGEKFEWVFSKIKSFGNQQTVPMRFGDGSVLRATLNHRWPFRKNGKAVINNHDFKYTKDIVSGKTEIPVATQELPKIDWEGYAHGFVFGDGWCTKYDTTDVELYGYKEDLLPLLLEYGNRGSHYREERGVTIAVRSLPGNWKLLPSKLDKNYALGFILGLVSADGSVDKRVQIFNKSKEVCEQLRRLAVFAGLRALPVRAIHSDSGYKGENTSFAFTILTYNLTEDHFVRQDQKSMFDQRKKQDAITVSDIDFDDLQTEEVFCAIVPEHHNFTLANHAVTLNCYAFPLANGAWTIRRFTRGCEEAKTWEQDGQGWTRCYFNKPVDFKLACKLNGGIEKSNGGWVFTDAKKAIAAAKMLGSILTLPDRFHYRSTILEQHKDKRLIIKVEKATGDDGTGMEGYDGSGKTWNRIFDGKVDQMAPVTDSLNLDKIVRHIVNEGGRDEGWVVRSDAKWRDEPLEHVKLILKGHFGYKPSEAEQILGTGAIQPYMLVNRPFDVEYPPGRLWNRRGAKLRFEPSQNIDSLKFPNWLSVMEHCGHGLDPFIEVNPWCKANGVNSGADYLIIWIAALFQRPYERLPYLFFYSEEQNTGKSTFHEALSVMMDGDPPRGYMKVNEALKAASQFNAELQHAIICVVEELDLNPKRSDAKISYNRIKELVTGNTISIHEKRQTPCMVKNTTHWIQVANDKGACPIFKNDSRITMIRVDPIDDVDLIPKGKLMELLTQEGPDFLAHIMRLEIPPSNDRLSVPVIETEDKRSVQAANLSLVEQYIRENCHIVDGATMLWGKFHEGFVEWMEPNDVEKWTKRYTGMHLPDYHPRGRRRFDSQYCIANLSLQPREPDAPIQDRLVLRDDKLVPLSSTNGNTNGKQPESNQRDDQESTQTGQGTTQNGS